MTIITPRPTVTAVANDLGLADGSDGADWLDLIIDIAVELIDGEDGDLDVDKLGENFGEQVDGTLIYTASVWEIFTDLRAWYCDNPFGNTDDMTQNVTGILYGLATTFAGRFFQEEADARDELRDTLAELLRERGLEIAAGEVESLPLPEALDAYERLAPPPPPEHVRSSDECFFVYEGREEEVGHWSGCRVHGYLKLGLPGDYPDYCEGYVHQNA